MGDVLEFLSELELSLLAIAAQWLVDAEERLDHYWSSEYAGDNILGAGKTFRYAAKEMVAEFEKSYPAQSKRIQAFVERKRQEIAEHRRLERKRWRDEP